MDGEEWAHIEGVAPTPSASTDRFAQVQCCVSEPSFEEWHQVTSETSRDDHTIRFDELEGPTHAEGMHEAPSLASFRAAYARLQPMVRRTPVWGWDDALVADRFPVGSTVHVKLELLQYTGTFKARGALLNGLSVTEAQKQRGLVAVSAGNHAIAVAFVAHRLGTSAIVVMPKTASPVRMERCRAWGAEVVLKDDIHAAFAHGEQIEAEQGRVMVHPFEGEAITLGAGGIGLEMVEQIAGLDAVVVPVGGGGLVGGIAAAMHRVHPSCKVYGVEPAGAALMHSSLHAGIPGRIDRITTIADSLGAPHAAPWSFSMCRRYLEDLVVVDDDELCRAMAMMFDSLKLAVEPASAAATAAILGPLRERLAGKTIGVLVCGANLDEQTLVRHVQRGRQPLAHAHAAK